MCRTKPLTSIEDLMSRLEEVIMYTRCAGVLFPHWWNMHGQQINSCSMHTDQMVKLKHRPKAAVRLMEVYDSDNKDDANTARALCVSARFYI
jgi:hypothetical protein